MTADSREAEPPPEVPAGKRAASRRSKSRLDEVFGDVLPDATGDDKDDRESGWADRSGGPPQGDAEARREDELRRNRPPHHG